MSEHASYPTGLRSTPTRHRALRERMARPGIVVAPGCYDCITARLVEVGGFDAAYITGSGVSKFSNLRPVIELPLLNPQSTRMTRRFAIVGAVTISE